QEIPVPSSVKNPKRLERTQALVTYKQSADFHKTLNSMLTLEVRASLVAQWLRVRLPMQGTR
ncbi:hypothetical protein DBR06_SOUSAS4110166, partial [Sousa chinensis]